MVPLARTQNELQRVARRVDGRVRLRGESPAQAAEGFGSGIAFFGRQRADEPGQSSSTPGFGSCRTTKTRSQTFFFA